MNEFERRLYDYLVEDGGACPPFFLQTVLGIGDFDALVEALNVLVAMGAVSNGPQGYRACSEWQETARADCAIGSAGTHIDALPMDREIPSVQSESSPCQCADDACDEVAGHPDSDGVLESRPNGDCGERPPVIVSEGVQEATHGCFDGMTGQEIERAFQGLFQELGIQEAQPDDSERIGFAEGLVEDLDHDAGSSIASSAASEEDGAHESASPAHASIARYDDLLDAVGLPTRVVGALAQQDIFTVEQLCCLSELTQFQEIGQLPRLGHKTEEDTCAWLDAHACHIDDEALGHLSQCERDFRIETDYFINRFGLLCKFNCTDGEGPASIHAAQSPDALMHLPLASLEIPGFTKTMIGSLERHGVRAVEDVLAMDTERVLYYRGGSVPKVGVGLGSRGLPQAVRGTENRLERRHSSACYAAFLPGIGLSATTSAMILAACSAAVPS